MSPEFSNSPNSMERIWYLSIDGKQQGPFTIFAIQTMIKQGNISENIYVWCHGMRNWSLLGSLQEFIPFLNHLKSTPLQSHNYQYLNQHVSKPPFNNDLNVGLKNTKSKNIISKRNNIILIVAILLGVLVIIATLITDTKNNPINTSLGIGITCDQISEPLGYDFERCAINKYNDYGEAENCWSRTEIRNYSMIRNDVVGTLGDCSNVDHITIRTTVPFDSNMNDVRITENEIYLIRLLTNIFPEIMYPREWLINVLKKMIDERKTSYTEIIGIKRINILFERLRDAVPETETIEYEIFIDIEHK